MQRGWVIDYASQQLKPHETRSPTHDLELGAVVFALNIWRHYLYGFCGTIYIDHKGLRHKFNQPNLNMRQHRWMDVVKDYDCDILYHKGIANMVANSLTRKSVGPTDRVKCMTISVVSTLLGLIREARAKGV